MPIKADLNGRARDPRRPPIREQRRFRTSVASAPAASVSPLLFADVQAPSSTAPPAWRSPPSSLPNRFPRSRSASIFPPTVRAPLGSLATCNKASRPGEAASAGSADLLPSAAPAAGRRTSAGRQGAGSRVGQRNGRGSWRSRLREMERRTSSLISPSRYSWASLSRWARTSS